MRGEFSSVRDAVECVSDPKVNDELGKVGSVPLGAFEPKMLTKSRPCLAGLVISRCWECTSEVNDCPLVPVTAGAEKTRLPPFLVSLEVDGLVLDLRDGPTDRISCSENERRGCGSSCCELQVASAG